MAGLSALMEAHELRVPMPRRLFATGEKHSIVEADGWTLLTPRHAPENGFAGHLVFALKYEALDLALLKRLFLATGPKPVEDLVRAAPTGRYARRAWFLYEWLTGERLDLPDAEGGTYVPVVDPELQWAVQARSVRRQRVHDNLPGTPAFCPLVSRTPELDELLALDLGGRAAELMGRLPADLATRAAAFLLLKDSKSSFAIEGEQPPADRTQRWGALLAEAGSRPLELAELLRMQEVVIGDARFVRLGLRTEGGFVGEHDRRDGSPIPDHVSARPEDLPGLVQGLVAYEQGAAQELEPALAAAALSFGFVYTHPFEDGNGRIHRALIHHVLARRGVGAPGVVLPISAVMLDRIGDYRAALEDYSARLLPVIDWHATAQGNVEVENDTADFYRYFDATAQAEFLLRCLKTTVEELVPAEVDYLRRHDGFALGLSRIVEMPHRTVDLLLRSLRQGDGRLSAPARGKEFAALTDDEVRQVEELYAETFESEGDGSAGRG